MLGQSKRLDMIKDHILSRFPQSPPDSSLEIYRKRSNLLNNRVLSEEFLGSHHALITSLRSQTQDNPLFDQVAQVFLSRELLQSKVYRQVSEICKHSPLTYEIDLNDPIRKLSILQTQGEYDISVSTRCIVSLCLYADTLQNLGTTKHRALIDRLYSGVDYGAFAMTELGHGSNVADLETTATFDSKTREFVLNSPTKTAPKWWIGAAGKTANMAVVWAQLVVDGERKGVHVFAVELREFETHQVKKGVSVGDCGRKIELDGIDNGFIIFHDYRVPYDSLLDKYCQINEEGKYKSSIKNQAKRLGIFLAGLIRGRFCVVLGSEINLRNALTVALRYSALRKQFGYPNEPERSILDYPIHRFRLIPLLSKVFAMRAGLLLLYDVYYAIRIQIREDPECAELAELHAVLSCLKPITSHYAIYGIQECRESTGGHGYSQYAGLGRMRTAVDVMLTWEGDNNVLIQQTGKFILKAALSMFKGAKNNSKVLQFLKIMQDPFVWPIKSAADITPKNLISIFEGFINALAMKSAMKLQENTHKFKNSTEVWNNTQVNYFHTLSQAFAEYILYQQFLVMTKNISSRCKETGKVIEKLCELYALDVLEKRQRYYTEFGCSSEAIGLIRDRHCELCLELGDDSVGIIDSIASSDRFIGSVLGYSDGQAYSRLIEAVEKEERCYEPPTWFDEIQKVRKMANK